MTKEVIVSVKGMQFVAGEDNSEPLETVTAGEYFYRNGSHYILFREVYEGFPDTTQNMIKIKNQTMEVRKKGVINVDMIFEANKKNISYYSTPFGNMEMGIATTDVQIHSAEERLTVKVAYALEVNQGYVADCELTVDVKSRNSGEFTLVS